VALHSAFITARVVLSCIAATLWILYGREILFRSGRIRAYRLKKGLADVLLMLLVALATFLVFALVSDFHFHRTR